MRTLDLERKYMTKWAASDPVVSYKGPTDHYCKLRMKVMKSAGSGYTALKNPTNPPACMSARNVHDRTSMEALKTARRSLSVAPPGAQYGDGRIDPVGHSVFANVEPHPLRQLAPRDYSSPSSSRSGSGRNLRTSYNEKAKSGFVYWYTQRPKPTQFGRYGIGSYKSVLGLGDGPRT